ncbi:stealth conserved region 3 domain-containing protein [Streptomyces globosus]|uniref:stealth conserved region 3 domain-containing protein n=1 Tax=Streptomyces globosus TaxID=68209 RepID=UPI0031D39C95
MRHLSRVLLPTALRRRARTLPGLPGVPSQPQPGQRARGQRERGPVGPADPPPRTREDELLDALPDAVRDQGLLAVVSDTLLPADVRAANLHAAVAAMEAAGIPYGLVPEPGPARRLAIAPDDRARAVEACAEAFAGRPFYARLLGSGGGGLGDVLAEALPRALADRETDRQVGGVRLYRRVVTSGRTLRHGPELGCDLDFWTPSASGQGGVASLRETPYGWWLPSLQATAVRRIGGRDCRVLDALTGRFPHDIDFPVDAVISWVDSADPAWRRRREQAGAAAEAGRPHGVDDAEHRYRDRGELRYCLRSIAAHAPWIRHVFLVTDRQTPPWLAAGHPGITVVDHRDLFADTGSLPVFNSHAIESQIHRIRGLSEHFLYFNDDIFLGREQQPQHYFLPSGLPKVFHDRRAVPPGPPGADEDDDVFSASQRATRRAVEEAAGRTYPYILAHTPYPLRRSFFARVEKALPGRLDATGRSVFRSATDLAPVTLAAHLALAEGRAVEGELTHAYVATDQPEAGERLADLVRRRDADAFCLADDAGTQVPQERQQRTVTAFLEAYFPVPSPYELP